MADSNDIRQRLADEVRLLLPELLDASTNYRAAKARYRRRRELFAGSINQDIEVAQDRTAKKAIADCSWYGSEMERLATTMLALLTALNRGRPGSPAAPPARPDRVTLRQGAPPSGTGRLGSGGGADELDDT
jgi:hypothetical protein